MKFRSLIATVFFLSSHAYSSSWYQINNTQTTDNLNAICLYGNHCIWTAGDSGTITASIDNGASWTTQTSTTQNDLLDICFSDSLNGWAIGDNGILLQSNNGGVTWTKGASLTDRPLVKLQSFSSDTIWICADASQLLLFRSNDGGTSWDTVTHTTDEIYAMHFINSKTGWVAGGQAGLYKTTNGGLNWNAITTSEFTDSYLQKLFFIDASTGWVFKNDGALYRTTNGGMNWEECPFDTFSYPELNGYFFKDALNGYIISEYPVNGLYVTADGGETWRHDTLFTNTDQKLYNGGYDIDDNVWIIGENGVVFTTKDTSSSPVTHSSQLFELTTEPSLIMANNSVIIINADNAGGIELYDMAGRLILSASEDSRAIDMNGQNPGVYFVKIAQYSKAIKFMYMK